MSDNVKKTDFKVLMLLNAMTLSVTSSTCQPIVMMSRCHWANNDPWNFSKNSWMLSWSGICFSLRPKKWVRRQWLRAWLRIVGYRKWAHNKTSASPPANSTSHTYYWEIPVRRCELIMALKICVHIECKNFPRIYDIVICVNPWPTSIFHWFIRKCGNLPKRTVRPTYGITKINNWATSLGNHYEVMFGTQERPDHVLSFQLRSPDALRLKLVDELLNETIHEIQSEFRVGKRQQIRERKSHCNYVRHALAG